MTTRLALRRPVILSALAIAAALAGCSSPQPLVQGVENAGEAAWNTIKAGAEDVAGIAGDVVHAAEASAEAVGDVAVDAWHGVEHLGSEAWQALENGTHRATEYASEAGHGIKTAAGYVGDGIGEVADAVGDAAGRMASYAALGAAAVERAFTAVA